ncbi:hypothetical protein EV356DRAFT_335888 [Viridothelium virens]|uniref:C2H2-type domain-containing protein n=1 Tax=Viridothelium virens TaxID=1048519 RepID=A0A6A6HJT0_VIRVR|nr:hypothetical protein EV356DRAFT_335888 [Viridothelium virens]
MSTPSTNPRRRAQKPTTTLVTPSTDAPSPTTMSLKKGDTFHSPTRLSSDLGNLSIASSPKRSYTSSQSLEDLVAGGQRVAEVIEQVNKTLSGFPSTIAGANLLKDPEVLPLPSFMLDRTSLPQTDNNDAKCSSKRRTRQADHTHGSDSGIGSSIGGDSRCSGSITSTVNTSAITKSHTSVSSSTNNGHVLSEHAVKHIQLHIVKPILAEESLKEFHPLVEEVPSRIGSKAITNIRDLEKTLIFLAPEYSASSSSYLRFCETAVRCIHATVPALSEVDQRLPADRPYTDFYFLDLIEQIRKYAAIMAATREKEAKGEALDEMDFSPSEKLTLKGGMTQDGSPLELVREKDGKTIPIASDEDRAAAASSKRSVSEESDDELAVRSMARRRKSDKPGDVAHACRACGKDFKRPCDLTKHEKTHSRPWKCPDVGCKYHEYGWPTEKEMQRHMNDKHSAAPSLFRCKYVPCSYSSKRESNCKQHMEKAHGWTYVRSKSNGRRKGGAQQLNTDISPAVPSLSTPMTPYAPSPVFSSWDTSNSASRENLLSANNNLFPGPNFSDAYPEATTGFGSEQEFDFNNLPMDLANTTTNGPFGHTPAMSVDGRRGSHTTSSDPMLSSNPSPAEPTAFVDAFTPDQQPDLNLATEFDHTAFMFSNGGIQQPTPATSVGPSDVNLNLNTNVYTNAVTSHPQHISPLSGQDVPLYSPADQMNFDEGYVDDLTFQAQRTDFQPPHADFELFPQANGTNGTLDDMFPDLPQQNATSIPYNAWDGFGTGNAFNGGYDFSGQR